MTGGPNPNPTSMATLSPRSLTLTLILILALSPFLSAAPLPHPSPSPARRPSPPQKHPPPSQNSHPKPTPPLHPKPTPPLKSHPSPPHQPHPPQPLPLTKSAATLNANPNTIHVGQHPPCSTPGQNCPNQTRLPLRNAPPGPPPPPLRKGRLNFGKKLGLLFAGIGVLLQIGLGGFLAFKRYQLKMLEDGPQVTRSGRRRLRVPSSASSS
ncbi:hypothetical protein IHE45_18G089500 [Dioscorea alata]|uniref:Uncharacterized protein n=1 Tax=Dioscorea alata TaxID=55571 RepID=A0ACB7U8R7_DIOAL|nr:hypothetical protein IHE45_18G089500 [Dioscorea alata]